ncbi:AtuA-related protein [Caldinitratiruptor microaerophilus]|uniref:AtuA-like ferredoxin-fold domain-containing protein n=1 Tax=Caldinitratiruptor microaerophilus TaxID=671077 RepID=A0AA35G7Y0_9FIRM|nr:hypothetical protein [Caldinitratiruptor microaerophilus]BDG59823.1 hypothetical protein caldi_09130 [Caldinitratiruptor microaerophilus]
MRLQLVQIATARAGDKGDIADISLFAPNKETYEVLERQVTADRVRAHFEGVVRGPVFRYELPLLRALKFVLHGALDGGAARSLRADNLGKTLGAALLRMEIDWPEGVPARAAGKRREEGGR